MTSDLAVPQVDAAAYPTAGVRISTHYHGSTAGKHRMRISMPADIAKILRRGLTFPHVCIDGDVAHGLRIWCQEENGLAPVIAHAGSWSVTLPARRVQAREDAVETLDVQATWEMDETGPVLLLPRVPDKLLPPTLLNKLPNSNVDHGTRMGRAETRLQRDMHKLYSEAVALEAAEAAEAQTPPASEPEKPPELPAVEPPSAPALDLREALQMVNELVDQLGDGVLLTIDANGHVQAKRRVVQYVDL